MLKFKTLILGMICFASSAAQAGSMSTGGGFALVCPDASGEPARVELLDVYEGRKKHKLTSPQAPEGATVQALIHEAIGKIREKEGYAVRRGIPEFRNLIHESVQDVIRNADLLPRDEAIFPGRVDLGPDDIVTVPYGCDIRMLGFYDEHGKLNVVTRFYEKLSRVDRAAFLLHEGIYKLARQFKNATDSRNTRKLVAMLLSSQPDPAKIFQQIRETIGGDQFYFGGDVPAIALIRPEATYLRFDLSIEATCGGDVSQARFEWSSRRSPNDSWYGWRTFEKTSENVWTSRSTPDFFSVIEIKHSVTDPCLFLKMSVGLGDDQSTVTLKAEGGPEKTVRVLLSRRTSVTVPPELEHGSLDVRCLPESGFTPVTDPEIAESLGRSCRDPNGLIWGDVVRDEYGLIRRTTFGEAEAHCKSKGARLPTQLELAQLGVYNGARKLGAESTEGVPIFDEQGEVLFKYDHTGYAPTILPNMGLVQWIWSSTVVPKAPDSYVFNEVDGRAHLSNANRYYGYRDAFRCVR